MLKHIVLDRGREENRRRDKRGEGGGGEREKGEEGRGRKGEKGDEEGRERKGRIFEGVLTFPSWLGRR